MTRLDTEGALGKDVRNSVLQDMLVWPQFKMKAAKNKNDTGCILITEAGTLSNVIATASLVSEIWRATERQTDRQTDNLPRLH